MNFNGEELTMLGALAPLTAIALIVIGIAFKENREMRWNWRMRALTAASVTPVLIALAIALTADVSTSASNLIVGLAAAHLMAHCAVVFWFRLKTASPSNTVQQPTSPVIFINNNNPLGETTEAPGPGCNASHRQAPQDETIQFISLRPSDYKQGAQ